MDSNISRW